MAQAKASGTFPVERQHAQQSINEVQRQAAWSRALLLGSAQESDKVDHNGSCPVRFKDGEKGDREGKKAS